MKGQKQMTKFTKFIFFSFFIGFLLCGCVGNMQSNSLKPNSQTKEWNSLFDSSDWQPVNSEITIENFNKKAM